MIAAQETSAHAALSENKLVQMTQGVILHHALCAAAKLGIADLLRDEERTTADLARVLSVHEDALYRLLRFLSGQGVFTETSARAFSNNPLSATMRADAPHSVRPVLLFRATDFYLAAFNHLTYCIETAKPSREKVFGMNGFEYLRHHPDEAQLFDNSMTAQASMAVPSIAAAYDFGQWGSITDVGGGNGILLAAILRAHPSLTGVLADLDHVIARARERGFLSADLASRASFAPCDFFREIPAGSRAYVMKSVIHDWDEDSAIKILRNCRRAVPGDGALLLVELALGESNTPSAGKAADVIMLVNTGGKERTIDEYRDLLAHGGFRLNHTVTAGEHLILEALPG
jgi:O-methyltransferase